MVEDREDRAHPQSYRRATAELDSPPRLRAHVRHSPSIGSWTPRAAGDPHPGQDWRGGRQALLLGSLAAWARSPSSALAPEAAP
ncbi:hypothetical protein PR202_ga05960 [Eleusine coracana subsp. coracana]|uniref:Uncharacterized protein n=1 Tax=Eleusine coracana subsp. coracana TaxID=191504 RepID=A0AAV5BTR8_ELECO|nr:hypothetical protein PR202_ga05960 [Eleusine coracana subsp. coracana]